MESEKVSTLDLSQEVIVNEPRTRKSQEVKKEREQHKPKTESIKPSRI